MKLRRIQLLNFHNFAEEILPAGRNLFLMGDNKSGKTTVLDGLHLALTGGVNLDLNAAAKYGKKDDLTRNLSSIFLRYDHINDVCMREPCVGYAAVEVVDDKGETHCFGVGGFATSLDTEPELWGFIAKNYDLEKLALVLEETADTGAKLRRPRDEKELVLHLGRGNVHDKGRYRTALAQFVYGDREGYLRVLELLAAAKSYHAMVGRARNMDALFIELLPPPDRDAFQELQPALTSIDKISANLEELGNELKLLRFGMDKIKIAREETERIARYEYLQAYRTHESAEASVADLRLKTEGAKTRSEETHAAYVAAEAFHTQKRAAQQTLQASPEAQLVARHTEAVGYHAGAKKEHEAARSELAQSGRTRTTLEARLANATAAYRQDLAALTSFVDETIAFSRDNLPASGLHAANALSRALDAAGSNAPLPPTASAAHARLRQDLDARQSQALRDETTALNAAERARGEADEHDRRADELLRQQELLPPGFRNLLARVQDAAPGATPLYQLLEFRTDAPETLGNPFETVLGTRHLCCIIAPPGQRARAREIVLASQSGYEIYDETLHISTPARGNLSEYVTLQAHAMSELAARYLAHVAGDLAILRPGTPRNGTPRAVWLDGLIFEHGAESRAEPKPPTLIGANARKKAAEDAAGRLRELSLELRTKATSEDDKAAAAKSVGETARRLLGGLIDLNIGRINDRQHAIASSAAAIGEHDHRHEQLAERVEGLKSKEDEHEARVKELEKTIHSAGAMSLRERLAAIAIEINKAREEEKRAHEEAVKAHQEHEAFKLRFEGAGLALQEAAENKTAKKDALLVLAEPKHHADLDDYVHRLARGNQVKTENIPGLIDESKGKRTAAFAAIRSSDCIMHEVLWTKYALELHEETRHIRDPNGQPIEEIYAAREEEVNELKAGLDEQTRDLLDRVLMAGLVRHLQSRIERLHETIRSVNELCSDLRFGHTKYQFHIRVKQENQRLIALLREESALNPASRTELREYFLNRLADLRKTNPEGIPDILDYRKWFDYILQGGNRPDGKLADLSRARLGFGSTGEQAVPNHLLILSVAALLYDQTKAKLRLLLIDEAFLGIDAAGRETLLQFADRCKVELVVATPELDGVTPSLQASTTLLIEKTPEYDVFVSKYEWERSPKQATLIPTAASGENLVIGSKDAPL